MICSRCDKDIDGTDQVIMLGYNLCNKCGKKLEDTLVQIDNYRLEKMINFWKKDGEELFFGDY